MLVTVIFYVAALLIIFAAIRMVNSTNLVHSTLFMAAAFAGIAIIYILLNADYLAIVQLMIYVGAISVLFVFGVMLTKRKDISISSTFGRYKIGGIIVSLSVFAVFAACLLTFKYVPSNEAAPESSIHAISSLLFNDDAITFEITGMLLLTATIGAIVIGRGVKEQK
ncbi:NADH-quinone oxidoreductase subunit J [Oxobacter pfennigii]|uniref:NADH-quinone oxidoreductase subunit J n=1 Tax=Oxobacter pfennigii TaxID=36849 RepID=A0A0P8WTV0_9CLOT|nr:NADH-quinone oxidoreductase subunit J [Oxobacter pfennigii]KPU46097.1 NADH-quinone oxidoreductase subunit J [Oxobacter pfennigii]